MNPASLDVDTACLLADLVLGTWTPLGKWTPAMPGLRMCWRRSGRLRFVTDIADESITIDPPVAANDRGRS